MGTTEIETPDMRHAIDTPAGSKHADSKEEVSLLDLLLVLLRRRRMILWATIGFAVVAAVIALLLPNEYTATVILLPPQQQPSLATALASQLGNLGAVGALAGGSLGIHNPNDMFVSMLKSPPVEDAIVRQFGLQQEYRERYFSKARKALEKHMDVDGSQKDNLIRISVKDHSPRKAAQMANAYVDQFRDLTEHLAISEASQRRVFFQQQLDQAKQKLTESEDALTQTERTTGFIQLDTQARALIESAANLRAQIAAKQVEIQGLSAFATGENSQLREARQELAGLEAQLNKLGGSQENPDSLIVPKGKVPQAGLEYARKLRDVQYRETLFYILARQYELAKLDEAREGALIQVVSPAQIPDRRSFPPRLLIVLGAAILGLLTACIIALSQAGWSRLREDPEANLKMSLIQAELRRGKRQL